MKIAYLSQSKLISDSANAVHVCRMCEAAAALGHRVALHALAGAGSPADVRDYYGLSEKVALCRHDSRHWVVRATASMAAVVPGAGFGALSRGLQGHLQIRHELACAGPDLIYARNPVWLKSAAHPAAPFVLEMHAPPRNAVERHLISGLLARPGFRGLVVISRPLREAYRQGFPMLDENAILVAHDGADLPEVASRVRADQCFRVGYVGHLYPGRGAEVILALARRIPEAEFHFVGGRSDDVARLRVDAPPNAFFHGHIPHSETARHLATFDAVLAPYQHKVAVHGGAGDTSAWMSPLKLFEYMSWARPILCSDLPVLREVLKDGETALMLAPDDLEAWERALRRVMQDPVLAHSLGVAARAELERSYTWTGRCERILGWAVRGTIGVAQANP